MRSQKCTHRTLGYAQESEKGNGPKLVEIMNKFSLTSTTTLHPPKNEEQHNLTTWTSGDGNIQKQLDYILVLQGHQKVIGGSLGPILL